MWIKSITRKLNEWNGSALLLKFVNTRIEGKAKVLNLQIDSNARTIRAEVLPRGQREPVTVLIEDYRIEEDDQRTTLHWSSIRIEAGSVDLPPGLKDKLEFIL